MRDATPQTIRLQDTWELETVYDSDGNPYKAYTNWMTGRVGMRLANKNCAVRIKNVEESGTNKKVVTDALLYAAYEKFTEFGMEPTHIFMNGRSREQLRAQTQEWIETVPGEEHRRGKRPDH